MLFDDQPLAERDHHKHTEYASQERHPENRHQLHALSHKQKYRHGGGNTEGDRFTGRPGCLHYVVFEDCRFAQGTKQGDRKYGDQDRRTNCHADFQGQIDRGCCEKDP